ncbi:hypothetical protein LTR37_019151 [Vermiconidia calcicola]|uniref:Uncharacterized protein n=1 Tax=Vermiconidia calcicola TaxID=1690605 RepID=A0ACC3MF19_9PEZI|nr:hypothetical protein LTR37_019151 [Vermiconidia calcicola]
MSITLHDRTYNLPTKPTVAVCVDGFDPEYLDHGIRDGIIPNLEAMRENGFFAPAKCAMPSFTNPNNVSIITGVAISQHGIVGNYFLDRKSGEEKMITDDSLLLSSTILELMSQRGVRVAAVTAKDKLRKILQHGLKDAICLSSEKADSCTLEENGITDVRAWIGREQPSQYSGDLSLYVMDAGVKLLEEGRAELFYLTLSDFVQHKYAPGSKGSNDFFAALDQRIGRLVELGAQVAVTGDHGMSDKSKADGTPNVLFLEDTLNTKYGAGSARVICPITDPFVRHHGALGSFVRVYASRPEDVEDILQYISTLPEVEIALTAQEAAAKLELRLDREGDIVVVSKKNAVIGSRKEEHDLSNLTDHRLRSHGGLSEQDVPLLMSRPAKEAGLAASRQWRNFDIFELLLNH